MIQNSGHISSRRTRYKWLQHLKYCKRRPCVQTWSRGLYMQVDTQFYAFRWITLVLTQEFPFPDVIRLWDSLFSDPGGHTDCLLRFCIAMLLNIRQDLLQGDFSHNIKLLQSYPPVDVHAIIHQAMQLKLLGWQTLSFKDIRYIYTLPLTMKTDHRLFRVHKPLSPRL